MRSMTQKDGTALPSPIYNANLSLDGSAFQTANYMDRIAKRSDTFAQAALLLKTWALQRNLPGEYGLAHCLYMLSILLAYVLDGTCKSVRTVPAGSGAWQAFKACLDCLGEEQSCPCCSPLTRVSITARTDFTSAKLVAFTFVRHDKAPTVADWQTYNGPVITEPTGISNLLAETPLSALDLVSWLWVH